MKPFFYFFFIIFIFTSCNKSSTLFEKLPNSVTDINFRNDLKENDLFNLIEYLYFYNGGGVAAGDINYVTATVTFKYSIYNIEVMT